MIRGGAKLTASVTRLDRGLKKITHIMKEIAESKAHVKAGVLGNAKKRPSGDLSNVELAIVQEFGTSRIPARSFIASPFRKNRGQYKDLLKVLLAKKVFKGEAGYGKALALIGQKMAADMKAAIVEGIPPPNAPSTIAAKGSSTPLIDTGALKNSITYAVVAGAGES